MRTIYSRPRRSSGFPLSSSLASIDLGLAESALPAPRASYGGVEFYPDPRTQAAILGARLVRNHPAPDGNKGIGLVLMLDFIERNGMTWVEPRGGQDEIAEMIERLAGKEPPLAEAEFVAWVEAHVEPPADPH